MAIADSELNLSNMRKPEVGETRILSSEQVLDRNGREYTLREVAVGDESDLNPELKKQYRDRADSFERRLRLNPSIPGTTFDKGVVTVPEDNEAARWLYLDEDGQPTQMLEWATRFPTAIALEPLQRLSEGGRWLKGGLDERTLEIFTYMVDGIGLRDRARIYAESLVEYSARNKSDTLDIISLGSGAAVPNIQATSELEASEVAVNWRFFDLDPQALHFARELIEEHTFEYSTFHYGPMRENPETKELEPEGQSYTRAFEIEDESVDVVDALGLWEYLSPRSATTFASKLYTKLKPGGSLIVSNMMPSRPQREFNQRAVGWPGLYLRDDTALLDIVEAAGIDPSQVTITHPEDGVYAVMEVRKL